MKLNKKILLILGVISGVSGCANLSDSPYYRVWHDRAYGMRAATTVTQQEADVQADISANNSIPEAEPQVAEGDVVEAQTVSYTEATYGGASNNDAYALESDPFQSYAQPQNSRVEQPLVRDYSQVD